MLSNKLNTHIFNFYSFSYTSEFEGNDKSILIEELKPKMKDFCITHDILGTILLAEEGINGALVGSINALKLFNSEMLNKYYSNSNIKFAPVSVAPFSKLKVKSKAEAVSMKSICLDINHNKGEYINPEEWDEKISKPDSIVIDVRNNYECEVGSFVNAINPQTETFREFPQWVEKNKDLLVDKKIYMYCTGGIRCEKSTTFLKEKGFKDVYHLRGGILEYLYITKNKNKMWNGDCFVFDDRISVTQEDYLNND